MYKNAIDYEVPPSYLSHDAMLEWCYVWTDARATTNIHHIIFPFQFGVFLSIFCHAWGISTNHSFKLCKCIWRSALGWDLPRLQQRCDLRVLQLCYQRYQFWKFDIVWLWHLTQMNKSHVPARQLEATSWRQLASGSPVVEKQFGP